MNRARDDRHLRLATDLSSEPQESTTRKFEQRILITGNKERLATATGETMLRVGANLIARFCPKIDFALPRELSVLEAEIISDLCRIDSSKDASFRPVANSHETQYAARLSIGRAPDEAAPYIMIDANGWLAILGHHSSTVKISDAADGNPFGALMASSLGAAEVFKELLKPLRPGKAFHFGDVTFSTYDFSVGGYDPGPKLPGAIRLPTSLLGGVGAVGNAFLLSLRNVPGIHGDIMAVDEESVDDPSNLNRYVLALEDDAKPENPTPKTRLATRVFENTPVQVYPFQESLDVFVGKIYRGEVRRPEVVLSAVDNNDARLVLQKLWPDLLLEGATDRTLSHVSRHQYNKHLACLLCIHDFEKIDLTFSYTAHMAELSGLPEEIISASGADTSLVVTEDHVAQASAKGKAFLSARVGAKLCSILSELEELSNQSSTKLPIRATVSFVSMIAGLLMAGELVKYATRIESALDTFFHIDSMYPLTNAGLQRVSKVASCYCSTRASEIAKYRKASQASGDSGD